MIKSIKLLESAENSLTATTNLSMRSAAESANSGHHKSSPSISGSSAFKKRNLNNVY